MANHLALTGGAPVGSRASERGQAMTETVLMAWGLILLIAIVVQVFFVDLYTFQLTSVAHARLFTSEAYPNNRPTVSYDGKAEVKLDSGYQFVPVVAFFRPYGLTPADLRIRSTEWDRLNSPKRLRIGRGTAPDVLTGIQGILDVEALTAASTAMDGLEWAEREAEDAVPPKMGK